VYAGPAASDDVSERALLFAAKQLAQELSVDFLELRSRKSHPLPGFVPISRYATFGMELATDEVNLRRLPRDTRYMIRKGDKAGLVTKHGLEQMNIFLHLFAQNMHSHGTPVFPTGFFASLVREFGSKMDLMVVYKEEQAVTGVLSFLFKDSILPYYAGASPQTRVLAANNFMYWELMKWATSRGIHWFDFGRSKKGTGAYDFKMTWNMNVEELDYQVLLINRRTVPNLSPTNPTFERATRIWRNLPFWASLKLGPAISRWFP
jgi:FemAB-related protein (PEP-CTERM system-associated)